MKINLTYTITEYIKKYLNPIYRWLKKNEGVYLKYFPNRVLNKYIHRELRLSYGKQNPDKTFYIIRRFDEKCGLFSWLHTILYHFYIAEKNGFIPVIDIKNYPNEFLEDTQVGKINAWELYFQQPAGYTLDDIQKSKNVVMCDPIVENLRNLPDNNFILNKKSRAFWKEFKDKYIRLNESIEMDAQIMYEQLIGDKKTLGVLCRGTDYWRLKPKNHPIQPNLKQIIDQLEKSLNETKDEWIYLCTEDIDIINAVKKKFDNVIIYPREYVQYTGGYICDASKDISKNQKTIDYLMQILILSKLKHIVAGQVGGTIGAVLFAEKYEYEYFWDLGMY